MTLLSVGAVHDPTVWVGVGTGVAPGVVAVGNGVAFGVAGGNVDVGTGVGPGIPDIEIHCLTASALHAPKASAWI